MPLLSWNNVEKETLGEKLGRKVINVEKATLAQIFLAKGGVIPKHHHESEELGCQLCGTAKVVLEDNEVIVHEDEIMHIPSNVPHSIVALEDCMILYVFSPLREDWVAGKDDYLRH